MPHGFAGTLREIRTRRRLSQLELALRADTSQRHVSFLEAGRSLPGRDIVLRLAAALELPLRERNTLMLAAGYAPAYSHAADLDDPRLQPVAAALRHILHGYRPFPALVIDRHGNLVAANPAVRVLTDAAAPHLLKAPVNIYRLTLHPEGLAPRIANLSRWRRRILQRLDDEARRNPDPALDDLLTDLGSYPGADADTAAPEDLGFAVPLHLHTPHGQLRLLTTLATFTTACDVTLAELKLEALLPADETTAAVLTALDAT